MLLLERYTHKSDGEDGMCECRDEEDQPKVAVELIKTHVAFIVHQSPGKLIARKAAAGEKYQYAEYDIGDSQDENNP